MIAHNLQLIRLARCGRALDDSAQLRWVAVPVPRSAPTLPMMRLPASALRKQVSTVRVSHAACPSGRIVRRTFSLSGAVATWKKDSTRLRGLPNARRA